MSFIMYITDKKTGKKYAYRATSVWDPIRKQPRSKREYLGRVNEAGEIIPKKSKRDASVDTVSPETPEPSPDSLVARMDAIEKRLDQIESALTQRASNDALLLEVVDAIKSIISRNS